MPVEYPVVIMAIKEWIGGHKTMPSQSMEIDGQPAVKKASFADMCTMAFQDLVSLAVTAGVSITAGGSAGFDKFVDGLSPALKEPLAGLKDAVGSITDAVPGGTSFIDTIKTTVINPLGDAMNNFKLGFVGAEDSLRAAATSLEGTGNTDLIAKFNDAANSFSTQAGGIVGRAVDNVKSWSDNLSLGGTFNDAGVFTPSNFKLTDAFNYVNNSSATLLSALRVTNGPTLTDLVGTLAQKDITNNLQAKVIKEQETRNAILVDINAQVAGYTGSSGGAPTVIIDPVKQAAWEAAHADLVEAAAAAQARVDQDKANVAMMLGQQTAVAAVGSVVADHGSITDADQLKLFEETIHPNIKSAVLQLSPMTNKAMTSNVTVANLNTGKTPGTYD